MLLRRWIVVQRRVIPQAGWTRRRLSTNPMAPDALLIAPANSAATGAAGNARKISYEEESFVSKHFGKISSVVLGIAGGLIYTYYLSIQDRKKVEEIIETSAAVDPYEILQCRYMNQLSKEEYISVLQALASHISTKQPITYREFINLATQGLAKAQHTAPIQSGFLLDRMVQTLVQRIVVDKKPLVLEVEPSLGPTSSAPVSSSVPVSYADEPLSADLLCVIFQLTMLREPADRCEAFFALGQMLEGNDISGHNASSDTLDGNTESTSSTSYDKQLKLGMLPHRPNRLLCEIPCLTLNFVIHGDVLCT